MSTTYYHAGPKGLTEIRTLGDLINSEVISIEQAQENWLAKWGDWIEEDALLAHPTMEEISLTANLAEASAIAEIIDGCVYIVRAEISRINEEGYPVCQGPVGCQVAA
jgi:hypothetical protein